MSSLALLLSEVELLLLFVVIALGLCLARVRLWGVALGPAAVLFVGLALSAWLAPVSELRISHLLKDLGLVLFVYCVGLTSGPGFVAALRTRGLRLNVTVLVALLLGAGAAAIAGRFLHLDSGYVAGIFSGALTNTPALGAATGVLADATLAAHAALAYSVTYPFGVLGTLVLLRVFAVRHQSALTAQIAADAAARADALASRNFTVTSADVVGRSIGELCVRDSIGVVVSRIARLGLNLVPTKYTRFEPGDVVTAVGSPRALESAQAFFGAASASHEETRHESVGMRRILVSHRALSGVAIDTLDLERRFNAQITRVRRGDLDLLPFATTRLQVGDRLRVVAPVAQLPELNAFFGDSEHELSEIDLLALSLGLALGLALAQVPLPLPGMSFSLGLAGGPLLVGLGLGQLGRTGRLVWSIPEEASTTLRELGLLIFLAAVGVTAGGQLRAVGLADAVALLGAGALVTLLASVIVLWLSARFARVGVVQSLGACSGAQTQPATLALAHDLSAHSPETYLAYAVVYPVAMVVKIVLAQLLARWS